MKLIKSISILTLLTSSTLLAQTTMCFKEKHDSMSTIENVKLEGGECKSTYSLNEMKEKGWSVDDIKITTLANGTYNFIYIFKDGKNITSNFTSNSNLSESELEARIMKRMEAKKVQEEKEAKIKKAIELKANGKDIYVKKCQSCHGDKGEEKAFHKAREINTLSLEQLQQTIARYTNEFDYGYGQQFSMRPYAASVNNDDIEAIYEYLKSVNK